LLSDCERYLALSNYVHSLWPFMIAGVGHYTELRPLLHAYADDLTQRIDKGV
jgi:hypothetical protein